MEALNLVINKGLLIKIYIKNNLIVTRHPNDSSAVSIFHIAVFYQVLPSDTHLYLILVLIFLFLVMLSPSDFAAPLTTL